MNIGELIALLQSNFDPETPVHVQCCVTDYSVHPVTGIEVTETGALTVTFDQREDVDAYEEED